MTITRLAPLEFSIEDAISHFARDLRLDKSPRTIETYSEATRLYSRFADAEGIEMLREITTASIRAWLTSLRDTGRSEATLFNRYSGLRAFLTWAVDEKLLAENPIIGIPRPEPVAPIVPLLRPDQLVAMLKACGPDFEGIRDEAILRLLLDSGLRRAELCGMSVSDLDLDQDVALVMGKGRRPRGCPFGMRTAKALRRYIRARVGHTYGGRAELWIGKRGPLRPEAIRRIVIRRAREAGVEGRVFTHQLRHTWAHQALDSGMNESDVQRLGGWRDREMLARYGASGADERARKAYREHSLGDRL